LNAPESINQQIASHYDGTPYTSRAHYYCAPSHIRAQAHLYGLDTVPLEKARVLELGCASGGNLFPFACTHPEAQVVGVDLSSVQVADGQRLIEKMGLKNMQLQAMSLADITPSFGQFDYIIAHGVFSWVPPEIKSALLRVCRENLSPKGIAYISYNTYPGWKAGDIVRDAMMLKSHGANSDEEKLASAKAMLTLLSDGLAASNPLATPLRHAVRQLSGQSDFYLAHEYLETVNTPCYFVEFVQSALDSGLGYVGDAEAQSELPASFGANVQLNLSLVAMGQDRIMRQQYLDFAVGRTFRRSLLTHVERLEEAGHPNVERLKDLYVSANLTEQQQPNTAPSTQRLFRSRQGQELRTQDPAVIAVIEVLRKAWPSSLSFDELVEAIDPRLPKNDVDLHTTAKRTLETLFQFGVLRLEREPGYANRTAKGAFQVTPGFRAVIQAHVDGVKTTGLFNIRHEMISLDLKPAEMFVLERLDGQNSVTAIRNQLCNALHEGLVPFLDGTSMKGRRNLESQAQGVVQRLIDMLIRAGVYVGQH